MIKRILAPTIAALLAALVVYCFVPPPRPSAAQFADQGTWAGTAGGTSNAVVLNLANVGSLNDIVGVQISFNPAANNTGPVTIAITNVLGNTTATALQRPSSIGLVGLSLNELWAGETTSVKYNGSVFVLSSNVDSRGVGDTVETRNSTAPRGTLLEDGSCYSQTTFAALFSVIGTTYNAGAPVACSGGQFAVPDSRGSLFAALDNQGANGAANRLTSAGSGCSATSVAFRCGSEKYVMVRSDLPNTSVSVAITQTGAANGSSSGAVGVGTGATIGMCCATPISATGAFNLNNNVTQTAQPNVPPVLGGIRAIKY
ncbi:phage tail protein [Bradyrhizobium erythrophlei]|uniref:Phage Tail Collar Domain n=1 Tax=Bradyrhizobium erythrophlei TaxID=1437360 RepID=A0A1M7UUY2_9BRAD|nr:phage tail protein [Bradyrhizobium erythrophlei]SHN86764.1 Phage Tail Collar Domain [Bradyrhizobium erythrophlei]